MPVYVYALCYSQGILLNIAFNTRHIHVYSVLTYNKLILLS